MANSEKKSDSKKKLTATVLAVALAVTAIIGGGTYAYLKDETEDVVNEFQTNQVLVSLSETTGNEYNIIPGMSDEKDPVVTVDNTVDSYVYVVVTDNTDGLVDYQIASGWTLLDGYDNVYYREVSADADVKEFSILEGDKVSYSADLENSDMVDEDGELKDDVVLSFKASAIQKAPWNDPAKAYVQADYVATTEADFKEALADAEEGESIAVVGDINLTNSLTLSTPVTIVGSGDATISGAPITTKADVTFENITFESPVNSNNSASSVYASAGTESITFKNVTFENPQWEAIQITSSDIKSVVVDGCTFTADNVEGAATASYGNTDNQAIRYIHIQTRANDVTVQITNNTFNDISNVVDSVVGIYYITGTITVGGNTFDGWADGDVTDGATSKLSVSWPEIEELKTVSIWEGENVTYDL